VSRGANLAIGFIDSRLALRLDESDQIRDLVSQKASNLVRWNSVPLMVAPLIQGFWGDFEPRGSFIVGQQSIR
jgi:hypothetical protein